MDAEPLLGRPTDYGGLRSVAPEFPMKSQGFGRSFQLEILEPRILLSGEGLIESSGTPAQAGGGASPSQPETCESLASERGLRTSVSSLNYTPEAASSDLLGSMAPRDDSVIESPPTPEEDREQPGAGTEQGADELLAAAQLGCNQSVDLQLGIGAAQPASSIAEQLTETLRGPTRLQPRPWA